MKKTPVSFPPEVVDDPVAFAKTFCVGLDGNPVIPHAGQEKLLRGVRHHTVIAAGRQWGKSESLSWYACWYLCTHKDRELYIIAPTLDQAKIIWHNVARQFSTGPLSLLRKGKIHHSPFPEIELVNGSRCHARGANSPEYIRGKRCHLYIVDEAAFIKDGVVRDVLEPNLTVTGQLPHSGIIMISTPFGTGEFYEQYQAATEDGEYYRRHHFTSLENPHADIGYLTSQRERYGEDSLLWRTEYLAEFVDGDMAVFPWEDIKAAVERYPYGSFPQAPVAGHRYVQGVDLANQRDWFVATVVDTTNPACCPLVHMDRLQKRGYAHYKSIVRSNHAQYNQARTLIDATTLAETVVEDLRDIGAEGYKFTGTAAKYEAVQELVRMFSERRVAIPNSREIIDELRYFAYEITPSKKLRMEARRGHDDIVMSLALAAILARQPYTTGFFMPVDLTPLEKPQAEKVPAGADPWAQLFAEEEEHGTD